MVDKALVRRTTDGAICQSAGHGADKSKNNEKKESRLELERETA
jgi:hypothetical protein